MPYDTSQFKPALYPDSSETSSSSPPISPTRPTKGGGHQNFMTTMTTRKASSAYRTERAKELKRMSTDDLIDLVLYGEHKMEKMEARLRKYALLLKEEAEKERQAMEEAKHVREKMTQTILDTQQEAMKARQDVEQYKLKLDNAQREIRRGIEVVKVLEDDKEETERALQRARDKARELKEKSAIQVAREQGRRIGFEEGLEQGRLVVQLSQVQAIVASRMQGSPNAQETQPATGTDLRRALTQGSNDRSASHRHRSSHTRRSSLDQHTTRSSVDRVTLPRQSTRRSSVDNSTATPQVQGHHTMGAAPSRPAVPTTSIDQVRPEFLQQARSDESRGSARSRDDATAATSRRTITGTAEIPPPIPPQVLMQARSDESQSSGSGSSSVTSRRTSGTARRASITQHPNANDRVTEQIHSLRPSRPLETTPAQSQPRPRQGPGHSNAFPSTSSAPAISQQPRRYDPVPHPGVPPAKQFPGGMPRDDVSEASTSPASTVGDLGIVTFPPNPRPPSAAATPQPPQPRQPPAVTTPQPPQPPQPRQPPAVAPVYQSHLTVDNGGSSRRTRDRPEPLQAIREDVQARPPSRTGGPAPAPPPSTQRNQQSRDPTQPPPSMVASPHIPVPQWFVHPPPDLSAPPVVGTSTPVHDPHRHYLSPLSPISPALGGGTGSNRSSLSWEFKVEPPSQPATPTLEPREYQPSEDPSRLSPNSRPMSLPPVQSQPQHHHHHHHQHSDSSPVVPLPVPPRVVDQATIYGTPLMNPGELSMLSGGGGISRPGSATPVPVITPVVAPAYEEAPSLGILYPAPLGSQVVGAGPSAEPTGTTGGKGKGKKGKGKRKSVTLQQPSPQDEVGGGFYSRPSSAAGGGTGLVTPPVVPIGPSNTILPVAPPTISPVLPPVVIPIAPSPSGGGVYRRPTSDLEDEISDTSFDSATKRNTHMNAQMYGQGGGW